MSAQGDNAAAPGTNVSSAPRPVVHTVTDRFDGNRADLAVLRPALRETSPRLGFVLVLGLAATLGLPGLAGFWGEVLAVYAAWAPAADRPRGVFLACAVGAAVGAALAAAYALRVARLVWVGDEPDPEAENPTPDAVGWLVLVSTPANVSRSLV